MVCYFILLLYANCWLSFLIRPLFCRPSLAEGSQVTYWQQKHRVYFEVELISALGWNVCTENITILSGIQRRLRLWQCSIQSSAHKAESLARMLTIFGQEESGSCLVSHTLVRRAGGRQWRLVLATLTSPKSHFRTALLLTLTLAFPILPFSAAEQSVLRRVSTLFLDQCSPREGYVLACVKGWWVPGIHEAPFTQRGYTRDKEITPTNKRLSLIPVKAFPHYLCKGLLIHALVLFTDGKCIGYLAESKVIFPTVFHHDALILTPDAVHINKSNGSVSIMQGLDTLPEHG